MASILTPEDVVRRIAAPTLGAGSSSRTRNTPPRLYVSSDRHRSVQIGRVAADRLDQSSSAIAIFEPGRVYPTASSTQFSAARRPLSTLLGHSAFAPGSALLAPLPTFEAAIRFRRARRNSILHRYAPIAKHDVARLKRLGLEEIKSQAD